MEEVDPQVIYTMYDLDHEKGWIHINECERVIAHMLQMMP